MSGYVELQCASHFSFLRGASSAGELFATAAGLGMKALAVTDWNTLAGIVRAHEAAKATDVRLIIGCRLQLRDGSDLLVYPTDRPAYSRLTRLLSLGKGRAGKAKCDLTWDDLAARSEGLIGIFLPERANGLLRMRLIRMRDIFGANAYCALTLRRRPRDHLRMHEIATMATSLGVATVATNDVLFHVPDRRILQDVVTCIRERTTIDDVGFKRERHADRYLKSPDEMARLFKFWPEAVARSDEIAERCRFSLDELAYQYPHEVCLSGLTPQEALQKLTWEGATLRYPEGVPEHVDKSLRHELGLIETLEYAPYFLTVNSIVAFARSKGILCQGRGSAANSAVCYVLGITSIDPERNDLLFERFVSQERKEPPDIDVDFEHERREEVIQWVYNTYGRHRAALCSTVIRYRSKGALRDVGKALGLPDDMIGLLSSQIWEWSREDVEPKHAEELNLNMADRRLRLTLEIARQLIGTPRHLSQHPGGFVLTEERLDDLVPTEPAAMEHRQVIEWDKDDIDALKFMKVDVLALGMLTCMRIAFDLMREHKDLDLDLASIPAEDPRTYAMIRRADTLGVFQIESRAQMSMLPRLKPRTFYDLVIEVAIVRPGPIQGDMVHPYLRRREGKEEVVYPKPELERVLGKTLGVWLSLDVSNEALGPETLVTPIKHSTKTLAAALLLLSMQTAHAQYTGTLAFNNVESGAAYAYGTNSTAIGSNAYAYGTNSIVLGFDASANAANSVAIGYGAVANRGAQTYTDPFSGQTVSSIGEVSFGSSAGGAQLTNLAPGSASTDAATVGQVESATSGILSQANSYTNSQTSGILSSAEGYAAGQASSALSSANSYTNSSSASTLGAAQTYTNNSSAATLTSAETFASNIGSSTLTSANNYTNTTVATTLSTAKTYADNDSATTLTSAEYFATTYANGVGSSTLISANRYTDTSIATTLSTAEAYADTDSATTLTSAETFATNIGATTLSAANSYTDVSIAATLSAAKSYADSDSAASLTSAENFATNVGTTTLIAANKYTDASSASTLSAAQTYADNDSAATLTSVENFATNYANGVGTTTLAAANKYTDASSAATLASANAYTNAVGVATLTAANNYTYAKTQFLAANSLLAPAQATGLETLSLGGSSIASGNGAIAIGSNAQATTVGSLAAGYGASVLSTGGVALGPNASVTAANSVALGMNSVAARGAQTGYSDPISGASVSSAGEVSVGSPGAERQVTNVAAGSAPTDAANVRQVENAEAIAVNLSETYTNNATYSLVTMLNSYGYNTSTSNGNGSVAVGSGATATASNSTALGTNSSASANNSVALGAGSTAARGALTNYKDPISGNTASSVGEVSVGNPGAERQITNVAPGTEPTDAANVAQVQAAIADANTYTDTMFARVSRQTWSVAAAAQALANLPQASDPGKSMVALSMGTSHGEMGVAFGGSYFTPSSNVIVRASASYSGSGGMSGGMAVGIVLN